MQGFLTLQNLAAFTFADQYLLYRLNVSLYGHVSKQNHILKALID